MKLQAQRIAIAETLGWEYIPTPVGGVTTANWRNPAGEYRSDLPDYLFDRNAMLKAVIRKILPPLRSTYQNWLSRLMDKKHRMATTSWLCITAEAMDHAEAFLRTLGLWDYTK